MWKLHTSDLFFNGFCRIKPMLNMIGICILETEIILFNQIQRIEDLLVELRTQGPFLW